jgi:hypothetical protein
LPRCKSKRFLKHPRMLVSRWHWRLRNIVAAAQSRLSNGLWKQQKRGTPSPKPPRATQTRSPAHAARGFAAFAKGELKASEAPLRLALSELQDWSEPSTREQAATWTHLLVKSMEDQGDLDTAQTLLESTLSRVLGGGGEGTVAHQLLLAARTGIYVRLAKAEAALDAANQAIELHAKIYGPVAY